MMPEEDRSGQDIFLLPLVLTQTGPALWVNFTVGQQKVSNGLVIMIVQSLGDPVACW